MNPGGGEHKIFKAIKVWKDVDWHLAETCIFSLQERIFAASENLDHLHSKGRPTGDARKKLLSLQRMLIYHPFAKLIAVKRVSEQNKGRKTAGFDKIANLSPVERLALAKNLNLKDAGKPIRTVEIPKPGTTKKRKLGIPVMRDRAQQFLVKMALEPTWEAKFKLSEPNSYGFRPGKGCHDATYALWHSLRSNKKYVLDADIKGFFDNIDHEKLLSKINCSGNVKKAIRQWLKAGKVKGFPLVVPENLEKTHLGTPQGGVISPLLANIALYGLEKAVKDNYVNNLYSEFGQVGKKTKASSVPIADRYKQINVIRYADDFVVIHPSEDVIKLTKNFVSAWLLDNVGVELSEEKTSVVCSTNGLNFLGFTITTVNAGSKLDPKWKTHVHVSKKAKERLINKVRQVLSHKSWSQEQIINRLNPLVVGWCNYYCVHECVDDFKQVEGNIFKMLMHWVLRREGKNLRGNRLKANYFKNTSVTFRGTEHTGKYIFGCNVAGKGRDKGKEKFIFFAYPSWVKSKMKQYIKVQGSASPYDPKKRDYWVYRRPQFALLKPRAKSLFVKQKGVCPWCNIKLVFHSPADYEVDHIIPASKGGKDTFHNLQLLHTSCHKLKTETERLSRNNNIQPS